MAAIVLWKKQTGKMGVKNWLITLIPLLVVMGLAWSFGVLIVTVKELVPLAYIYTILVAFQGVWIFLTFVVFNKQVRDKYVKLCKSEVEKPDQSSKNTLPSNMVRI